MTRALVIRWYHDLKRGISIETTHCDPAQRAGDPELCAAVAGGAAAGRLDGRRHDLSVFQRIPLLPVRSTDLCTLFWPCAGSCELRAFMGSMLLLLLVGPGIEEKYGHRTTALCIAATALVTGLVQFIFFPNTVLLGASGVVFMMIVLSSFTEMGKEGIPITLILVVIFYLGGELLDGLTTSDNVSQLTHIVGGLCGLVFGFTIKRHRRR